MTVTQALRRAARELETVSDTARLDAELLMAQALGVSRSELLLRHHAANVPARFEEFLARRLRCEPIAYILGRQQFRGLEFRVTPDVLIPRSDSECVVDAALSACAGPARVLDCGTGSGALLLSFLAERTEALGVGIDVSPAALAVAESNAAELGLAGRVRMLRRDWTQPVWRDGLGRFDLVLANPPYVESTAELDKSVRLFEPETALFAGPEGLDAYRCLVPQLPEIMQENGFAVVEIGAGQADSVGAIAAEAGFRSRLVRDLAGRPRALLLH